MLLRQWDGGKSFCAVRAPFNSTPSTRERESELYQHCDYSLILLFASTLHCTALHSLLPPSSLSPALPRPRSSVPRSNRIHLAYECIIHAGEYRSVIRLHTRMPAQCIRRAGNFSCSAVSAPRTHRSLVLNTRADRTRGGTSVNKQARAMEEWKKRPAELESFLATLALVRPATAALSESIRIFSHPRSRLARLVLSCYCALCSLFCSTLIA